MKKQLCLFLIINFSLLSFTNSAAKYDRFIHTQQTELEEINLSTDRKTMNLSLNKYCLPIYNTEANHSRKLKEDIFGFKLETNIINTISSGEYSFDVIIFENDFPKEGDVYNVFQKETCQTYFQNQGIYSKSDIKISCSVKEFKKSDVVAICSYTPKGFYSAKQTILLKATGFTKKP